MKTAFYSLFLLFCLLLSTAHAATFPAAPVGPPADSAVKQSILQWSPKAIEKATGKKLSWYQKLQVKILQKRLSKVTQGEESPISQSTKVLSVVSLVASSLAIITLIAGLGAVVLLFLLTGLITGIIALASNRGKGNKYRTMAILGVVLSGVVILLAAIVLAAWAAWGGGWG